VFEHTEARDVLRAHAADPPPRVSSFVPRLAAFDAVLERALAKAPEDRHPTCAAFMEALDAAASEALRLPSSPPCTGQQRSFLRVVILERDENLRRHVERVVERALADAAAVVEIEHVECRAELFAAFACQAAHLVIVDDASVSVGMAALVEAIRRAPGGLEAEVLVLSRDLATDARLVELGTRQLPKPLNLNALTAVVGRMGARAARIATGSHRRALVNPRPSDRSE
jgi:serine/threonine-protein kinase